MQPEFRNRTHDVNIAGEADYLNLVAEQAEPHGKILNMSDRSAGEPGSSDAGEALFCPSLCVQRYQAVLQLLASHNITSGTAPVNHPAEQCIAVDENGSIRLCLAREVDRWIFSVGHRL